MQMYKWIHSNWSKDYEISLSAKGFIIVYFQNVEDYQKFQEEGHGFWGRVGCFVTLCASNFDPCHTTVSITLVWVRLLNFPMHFLSIPSMQVIGNSLGKYLKKDIERVEMDLATYARICVDLDISEGLLVQIILI